MDLVRIKDPTNIKLLRGMDLLFITVGIQIINTIYKSFEHNRHQFKAEIVTYNKLKASYNTRQACSIPDLTYHQTDCCRTTRSFSWSTSASPSLTVSPQDLRIRSAEHQSRSSFLHSWSAKRP